MVMMRTGRWWLRSGANNTTPMNSNHNIELVLALYIHGMMLPVHDSAKYRSLGTIIHTTRHGCRGHVADLSPSLSYNSKLESFWCKQRVGKPDPAVYIDIVGCWIVDMYNLLLEDPTSTSEMRIHIIFVVITVIINIAIIITKVPPCWKEYFEV